MTPPSKPRRAAIGVVIAALAMLPFAAGEDKKKKEEEERMRSVTGHVFDAAEKPVPGAVVQLKNAKTLQVRSFITRPDGTFFFQGLDPNTDFSIRADHGDRSSDARTISSFDSRKKLIINLRLTKPKEQ